MNNALLDNIVGFGILIAVMIYFSTRRLRFKKIWNSGCLALKEGDMALAERAFRKCLKHQPQSAALQQVLATVLTRQNHLEEAEELYIRATQFEPRNAETHLHLGFFYALCVENKTDEAIDAFSRAVEFAPATRVKLLHEPRLAGLQDHPRFEALVTEVPRID